MADEVTASLNAAMDELHAARGALRANPGDRRARLEYRQAQERVADVRRFWREIGVLVGDRPWDEDRNCPGMGVKITNNDGS